MSGTPDEVSFTARHAFDRRRWQAAAVLAPIGAGSLGTLIYVEETQVIWGFLFVLWFVVADFCLIGTALFREANPAIASRVAYCGVALAGAALGALLQNRWGGAIPILTMLVAVIAALILEQLFALAPSAARPLSGRTDRTQT